LSTNEGTNTIYWNKHDRLREGKVDDDDLDRCAHGGIHLDEVGLEVSLQVEEREDVSRLQLQECRQLGVSVDLTAIGRVLELVGLDVQVDLSAHVRARHQGARRLAEEGTELVTDQGGAHKAGGLAVAGTLQLAAAHLLCELELLLDALLQHLELVLQLDKHIVGRRQHRRKGSELLRGRNVCHRGTLLGRLGGGIHRLLGSGGRRGGSSLLGRNGSGGRGGGLLGRLLLLLHYRIGRGRWTATVEGTAETGLVVRTI